MSLTRIFLLMFFIAPQAFAQFTLTATVVDGGIDLSWDGISGAGGYDLYYCEDTTTACTVPTSGGSNPPYLGWITSGTTYQHRNLTAGTTYRYQVTHYVGGTVRSNVAAATTPAAPGRALAKPAAPSGLTSTAESDTSITLSWIAPPNDGQGEIEAYNVYRCEGVGCVIDADTDWLAWVTTGATYTDRGTADKPFISGTTHRYAVAAYRNEEGNWSNEVEAVAQSGPSPGSEEPKTSLSAPTGLTVTTSGGSSVNLTWTAPADGLLGYDVYRCSVQAGEATCELKWHAWVANEGDVPPAPTSYTDTGGETGGVTAGAVYMYVVAASYPPDYAGGDWSEAVTVTAQGVPSSTGEFEASFESGHQWFRRHVIPQLSGTTTWHSIAWKGERIQQHILVNNVLSNSRISLTPSDLASEANDTIPAGAISFRYPRFVAGHTEARSCSKDYPEDNTTAYLSDALFSEPAQALPPSWPELVWMSVDIPSDTPAGEYSGTVSVSAESGESTAAMTTLQVSIQVAPWTMPDAADRQFHLDLWQFPVSVLDRYNDANPGDRIELWSEEHYALLEPTYRYLAGLGQRTVTTYIKEGALGAPSMIQWTLKRDGAWEYDYSVFDTYVSRLASWGLDQQISAFSPVGWNEGDIPYWDEANQRQATFSAEVGSSDWNARWQHFLTDFRGHLLGKEWLDKTVLYLDESSEADVQAVIDLVGSIDEDWKIGLAYIGYGHDGPGEQVLDKLYDSSGSMVLVGTTYVDTGLITGETYRYAVDAVNDRASAASSPITVMAQAPAVPGEPTGLTGMNVRGITLLNWTAPAVTCSALTGYNVYRCLEGDTPCTPTWFDRVESGNAYTDSDLTANTAYRYTVEACNGVGCGNRSDAITVMSGDTVEQQSVESCTGAGCGNELDGITVSEIQGNQAVPDTPTELTAFAASATAIQLSWEGNATNGYDVYRCVGSQTCAPVTYWGWAYADNYTPDPDRISTYYTSCVQPRPNSFVAAAADPSDVAALPWHALQRRQDGYLRWAFDNWRSSDPMDVREGAFTAGDFSLVYRSSNDRDMTVVPSIRSEMLRDGIEDFEKVRVLRSSLSTCGENNLAGRWLDRLESTVDTFSSSPLMAGRAGSLIGEAHDRLGEISLQLTPGRCQ